MNLETFFEKFDFFADAPDAVAKMRELVLELAVRGQLSECRTTDQLEPAWRAFIEEFDNRIYGSDPGPPPPFKVPSEWCWVCMEDVADACGQKKPDGPFTYIDIASIDNTRGAIKSDLEVLTPENAPSRARKLVQHGTVIYATVRPYLKNIAVVDREFSPSAIVSTAFAILHPRPFVDGRFLFHWLRSKSFETEVAARMKGVAYPAINDGEFRRCPVPLPPLVEQKRIIAKVDELMALCDRLEAQQQERETRHAALARASLTRFAEAPTPANLQFLFHKSYTISPADLRKSILTLAVQGKLVSQNPNDEPADDLISRIAMKRNAKKAKRYDPVPADEAPYEVPFSWSWVRLGNISLTSESGWSPQCLPEARSGTDWGVLKVSAVSWSIFKPDENKALPPGMTGRPDCEVKAGDFLLSRANTEELVARSVVVDQTPPRLMMSDKIVRFTFPDEIEPAFINLANTSDPARTYYARNASGTSSSMKNVGREVMCNLPIPLPPLAEQRRIVAKVDQLMALVNELETQLATCRATGEKLLDALVAEFTKPQEKPAPARPVIEPRKYLVQFVAALLSNVRRPIFFQELTRTVAFLFLPNRLLPLAESVGGAPARRHFENFAQANADGALAEALKILHRADAISYVRQGQEYLLKFHPAKSPPIAPLIEQDGKYMTDILDLLPAEGSLPAMETQAQQLEKELIAVM